MDAIQCILIHQNIVLRKEEKKKTERGEGEKKREEKSRNNKIEHREQRNIGNIE